MAHSSTLAKYEYKQGENGIIHTNGPITNFQKGAEILPLQIANVCSLKNLFPCLMDAVIIQDTDRLLSLSLAHYQFIKPGLLGVEFLFALNHTASFSCGGSLMKTRNQESEHGIQ